MILHPWKVVCISVLALICSAYHIDAQEINITPQLKQIEWGELNKAKEELNKLKQKHSKDPSVLYLDALLTEDAKDALSKYTFIADKHPKSTYADASLYKIYSYYYALGLYSSAKNVFDRLSKSYPQSPYIKMIENKPSAEPFVEEINPPVQSRAASGENQGKKAMEQENFSGKNSGKNLKRYTIQAGAFLNIDNARKLKEAFKQDGYSSDIKFKEVAGSTLNVVSLGSFSSEEEARSILLLINERYKLNGRIIPLEQ